MPDSQSDTHCPRCGCYAPMSLGGERGACGCGRTAPLDGLPPTIYACPVCAGHGRSRWGCWGSLERPHDHAFMEPIHELILGRPQVLASEGKKQ
jgi:hypothetical protein